MAKAKGGLFSLKAQGRLGDAVAFRGSHGRTVLQKISPSGKPASAAQAAARAGYAYNCQVWQSLPPAVRALWADERPQVSTNKGFSNFMSAVSGWVKWYNPAWLGRVKVTMAAPALAGFPVLTTQNQLTADFFADVLANGADIVVTAEDGITKLPRELVSINKAGSTIELYHASPAGATVYFVYYFNAAGAEVNDTAVWDTVYDGVWHLKDGIDNAHVSDSTVNATTGAKTGANNPQEVGGAFLGDKAQSFDPTDLIDFGSPACLDYVGKSSLGISVLYKPNAAPLHWQLLVLRNLGADDAQGTISIEADASIRMYITTAGGTPELFLLDPIVPEVWNLIHLRFDGVNLEGYFNGLPSGSHAQAGPITAAPYAGLMLSCPWANARVEGQVSMLRFSSARPAAWILAEYNNIMNNAAWATGQNDNCEP